MWKLSETTQRLRQLIVGSVSQSIGPQEVAHFDRLAREHAQMRALLSELMGAMQCNASDGYWRIGPMADPGTPDGVGGKVELLRELVRASEDT